MPHSSRRPRVSSDRRGTPGQRPSRRRSASQYGAPRAPQQPRVKPRSELEVALDAGWDRFVVPMPSSLKDGKPHEIHAVVSGTNVELKNSPRRYQFRSGKASK